MTGTSSSMWCFRPRRPETATQWRRRTGPAVGYVGSEAGAPAALRAAAADDEIGAVVSLGGRPELAGPAAPAWVRAPPLLVVLSPTERDPQPARCRLDELSAPRRDGARCHGRPGRSGSRRDRHWSEPRLVHDRPSGSQRRNTASGTSLTVALSRRGPGFPVSMAVSRHGVPGTPGEPRHLGRRTRNRCATAAPPDLWRTPPPDRRPTTRWPGSPGSPRPCRSAGPCLRSTHGHPAAGSHRR